VWYKSDERYQKSDCVRRECYLEITGILVILWIYFIPIGPVGTQQITFVKAVETCNNLRFPACFKESSLIFLAIWVIGLLIIAADFSVGIKNNPFLRRRNTNDTPMDYQSIEQRHERRNCYP